VPIDYHCVYPAGAGQEKAGQPGHSVPRKPSDYNAVGSGWLSEAQREPLWSVLQALGLTSDRPERRTRPYDCPACGARGLDAGQPGSSRAELWKCHRCDAGGNTLQAVGWALVGRKPEGADDWAQVRAWYADRGWCEPAAGERRHPQPRPRPALPAARTAAPRLDVAAAWDELQTHRDRWDADARAYLGTVRGWTDDLVGAALDTGWIAYACDLPRGPARRLVDKARDRDRLALFALYGPAGVPRSAELRWHRTGPPSRSDKKALSLPNSLVGDSVTWGGVRAFGRVPEAVRAVQAGGPVYLCEGGPDTLAAAAWCRLQGRGAALGAPSGGLVKVARALADALEAAQVERARVVIVPHLDPAGQKAGAAAADALRGRVAVDRVALPEGGDLADAAAGLTGPRRAAPDLSSADALAAVLGSATRLHSPPLPILGAAYRARMAEVAADAVGQAQADRLVVVSAPVGAGKSQAFMRAALDAALGGRTVVWAVETHTLGDEHAERLEALTLDELAGELEHAGAGVPVHKARGALHYCQIFDRLEGRARDNLRRTYLAGGRRALCGGCPFAADCEGSKPMNAPRGAVTVAAHAALPRLKLSPDALVVVDELPAILRADPIGAGALGSLRSDRGWARKAPLSAEAAATVAECLDELARAHDGEHARTLPPDELADALAKLNADPTLQAARDENPEPPSIPFGDRARAGGGHGLADRSAWDALRACLAIAAGEPAPDGGSWGLRLQPHGAGWELERRTPLRLPEGVPTVALDATAGRSRIEWQAWAQVNARDLVELDSPGVGEKPAFAVHYATQQIDSRRMYRRGPDGRARMTPDAPGSVRGAFLALADALQAAGVNPADGVGVLANKPLADALRLGAGLQLDTSEPACDPDCPNVQAVGAFAADLAGRGWRLQVGHLGRHHRGWDALKGLPVAVLGPMRPELAAVQADAAALAEWGATVDASDLSTSRAAAATVQALGRARHLRTGAGLFLAAKAAPPAGGDLPGVTWDTKSPTHASTGAAWERRDLVSTLRAAGAKHLQANGWIACRWFEVEHGAARRLARRVTDDLASGANLRRVPGINGAAWASGPAADEAARAWFAGYCIGNRNDSGRLYGVRNQEARVSAGACVMTSTAQPTETKREKPSTWTPGRLVAGAAGGKTCGVRPDDRLRGGIGRPDHETGEPSDGVADPPTLHDWLPLVDDDGDPRAGIVGGGWR